MKTTIKVYDTEFDVEFQKYDGWVSVTSLEVKGHDVGGLLECRQFEDALYNAIDEHLAEMYLDEVRNNE